MKVKAIGVIVLFLAISFSGCGDKQEKSDKSATSGSASSETASASRNQAYSFELETLEGETVRLADYQDKVLILDIWDTWCPPCRAEIPHFIELYDEYNAKGLEILGVAAGRYGRQAVVDFAQEYQINYPNALGTQDLFQGFGGITNIPTTFVIDQNGNIYQKYIGYRDKSVFENDIKALLDL